MSPIIDMQKRLVEVGRIRMGRKSERGAPQKLETFRFTSRDQARLAEIGRLYGGTVAPWQERPGEHEIVTGASEVPILLLPGQALSQWYELWTGGGCQRRCDGVTDVLADKPCQCPGDPEQRTAAAQKGKACKPTTRLSVMLPDIPGLGVWRLESHGYYAAVELAATAGMLEQATAHGQVFPARLRIDQRSQIKDGKTSRYSVPVIDIDVRLPDALGTGPVVPALQAPAGGGYQPIAQLPAAVTVDAALEATARQATPAKTSARSAEPIGQVVDFTANAPIPVPDEPAVNTPPANQPPANVPPAATPAQLKKLNVIVTKLRDSSRIETRHLWSAVANSRSFDTDQMIALLGGLDDDGRLRWSPLRDTLTRPEATELIDRLTTLEQAA